MVKNEVIINKPKEHVWRYLNDPDNLSKWIDGLEKYERLSGDPKNPKPGDKGRHTYNEKGRQFVMEEEMLEYNAPDHIKLLLTSSWFDLEITNDLEDIDGKTKLTASADFTRTSLLMRAMMLFKSKSKQREEHARQLRKVKELIEAQ